MSSKFQAPSSELRVVASQASGVLLALLALSLAFTGCASAQVTAPDAPEAPITPEASGEEEYAPPPPPDAPVRPDSLAMLLLDAALEEADRSMELYNEVIMVAAEERPDAQNRARQRTLEAALAAERAETLMRIRFALLGGAPTEAEGEMRLYLSFLAVAADDLLEVDAIDPILMARFLPDVTDPLRDAMRGVRAALPADE